MMTAHSLRSLLLLTILTLTTSACGSSAPAGAHGIYVRAVPSPIEGIYEGYATWGSSGRSEVLIYEELACWRMVYVIMHELWHAVGYAQHGEQGCITGDPAGGRICPDDLAAMSRLAGPYDVHVVDEWLRPAVSDACHRWNVAVGRVLFVAH